MVEHANVSPGGSQAPAPLPRFLSDQPCVDPDRIRFGHEVYVTALQDAVRACPTPFVMGLYGKWGTGKTTVLEGLRSALQKRSHDGREFKVCLFDAWKYSEEASFRRQFLAELNEQLRLGWDLDSLLYKPKEDLKLDYPAVGRNLGITVALFALVTLMLLVGYVAVRHLGRADLADVFLAAGVGGMVSIVIFVVGAILDLFKISTYKVTHPLIFAPEQFEKQFRDMLHKAKITDHRRLVVLVDNLDRCAPDAAVSALKTIKTFLEHEGCIFVVACDEAALVRHLTVGEAVYDTNQAEDDAKEFLRKFFQATVEVEPPADDLRDFASELVQEAGLQRDVATVVWAASPTDPRRIVQFANRLTLALHVVRARERSGRLPSGVVSTNQPYLAKVLWLSEHYEDFARDCVLHPELLSLVDETIKYPDMQRAEFLWSIYLSADARAGKCRDLYRFLEATAPITTDNPSAFFTLQLSALDMGIDNPTEFKNMLRQGLAEEIRVLVSQVTDKASLSRYREIMTRTIEQELAPEVARHLEAVQACRAAVRCFDLLPQPRGPLADAVCAALRGVAPVEDIPRFHQQSLVQCVGEASPLLASRAREVVVQSLDHNSPHTDELLAALQEQSRLLDASLWGTVGDFLIDTLSQVPDTAFRYLNTFDEESDATASLLKERPNLLAQLAARIAGPEPGVADSALDAFGRLRNRADPGAMNQLCTSITGLLSAPPESRVDGYFARSMSALDHLDTDKTSREPIPPLHNAIRNAIGEPLAVDEIVQLLRHLLRLYALESEPQQQEVVGLVQTFAHSRAPDKLALLGDIIWTAEIEPVKAAFTDAVAQRASDPGRDTEQIQAVLAAAAEISLDAERSMLSTAIAAMLNRPELPMKDLGARQLVAYAERLPSAVVDQLVTALHGEYMARSAPESKVLLAQLLELVPTQREKRIRNAVADRLKKEMIDSDPSVRRHAGESYTILRPRAKLSQSTRKNVAQDLADGLYRVRSAVGLDDAVLFDVLLEEQDNPEILHSTWKSLADTIESLLHSDVSLEVRRMACNLIPRFQKLPEQARDGILEQLQIIAEDAPLGPELTEDASSAIAYLGEQKD